MLSCATIGLAVSVSPCFAQTSQEMQPVQEMRGIAPQRPLVCDSLDPKVCFDIYRRRMEQPPEWPAGKLGQATAPFGFGKALSPSFKLPSREQLQEGTRIR